ncbi:MAG: GyrI-like domain-containing protein [Miniphocaeibacter sp.]|uniref:MerR family transcriptional regulator n=1 Tax=Miniphocaeibacter sp. TaxID=3100973 RepID=UPI0017B55910|nr:MerR family transcriptional regulator [Gallicola sp.]
MLTIGQFSKISNTTVKTLHYYDEINLLKPAKVDEYSGYRYYNIDQLDDMILIQKFKKYGFSLDEVKNVISNSNNNKKLINMIKEKRKKLKIKISESNYLLKVMEKDLNILEKGDNIMAYMDNIEIKINDFPKTNILSTRNVMNIEDYNKYVKKLFKRIEIEKLTITGPPMTIYYDEEFIPESTDTELAIPILEEVAGTRIFQPKTCVMAIHRGAYTELSETYAAIVKWIEENNYILSSAPFEIYLTNVHEVAPEDNITEIYFPIKSK